MGQELFVGDVGRRCVHAFSLDGRHTREIRVGDGLTSSLCSIDDRLYVITLRKIFALTPEGETLQAYEPTSNTLPINLPNVDDSQRPAQLGVCCHSQGVLIVAAEARYSDIRAPIRTWRITSCLRCEECDI
jgi:hypothetical protein|eukprot:6776692-Prymnesium_polylepis.3